MNEKLELFWASREVHDREIFYRFLENIYKSKNGQLRLVLGGKSVGKSLVLNDFKKKLDDKVGYMALLVDGRLIPGSPLSEGILTSYKEYFKTIDIAAKDNLKLVKFLGEGVLKGIPGVDKILALLKGSTNLDVEKLIKNVSDTLDKAIKSGEVSEKDALQSFVDLAKRLGYRPVLIIDEANKVLGLCDGPTGTSQTLDTIVALTKQSGKLDVVMASSEYAYPYLLEENGLNLNDISEVLFAGEVPPHSMWELLVTKKGSGGKPLIGMGKNLVELLIASYGGHFLRIKQAVSSLVMKKEKQSVDMSLNPIAANITRALKKYPKESSPLLRKLAVQGFALVEEPNDPVVEMIVRSNIGGIIGKLGSTAVGLGEDIWTDQRSFALIPTSESARNLISIFTVYEEARRAEEARLAKRRWWKVWRWGK